MRPAIPALVLAAERGGGGGCAVLRVTEGLGTVLLIATLTLKDRRLKN